MANKQELRALVRERLGAQSAESIVEKSQQICAIIGRQDAWREARIVCLFAALPTEPNIDLLWDVIRGSGKKICYPRVEGDHLNLMLVDSLDELFASRWQLREPVAYEPLLQAPDKIDLILVPGLAFSQSCQRLGRGGGYYDRLLASENLRARKIGVCFDLQTFPELPVESHDVCVDAVVTEMGIFPSAA